MEKSILILIIVYKLFYYYRLTCVFKIFIKFAIELLIEKMNRLLVCLSVFVILICSFAYYTDVDSVSEENFEIPQTELNSSTFQAYSTDANLWTGNTISSSNSIPARVQRTLKRFENLKHNFTYIKSDKVVNTGLKYSLQENSINLHSFISQPNYRLILHREFII